MSQSCISTKCKYHKHDPQDLQIMQFKESYISMNPIPKIRHYACSFRHTTDHLWYSEHYLIRAIKSKFVQHIENIQQYKKDEEITNYIKCLSSTFNHKKGTVLLALFLLSKYRSNYEK